MTRRAWLAMCAACCLVRAQPAHAAQLLALFTDLPGAQRLGALYAAGMAEDAAALASLVRQGLSGTGPLRAQVAALVEQDFAAGRMACVDGWLLSVTEARLCALAARQ